MNPIDERRHLTNGPYEGESPGAVGLVHLSAATATPTGLLFRCREVLDVVLTNAGEWPSVMEWARRLPRWFVDGCLPEQSDEQRADRLQRWRALPPTERYASAQLQSWSLGDWLHWLQPDERSWFWWSGTVHAHVQALITVEVPGWPAPIGSLDWLLRVAGAEAITIEPST